ncbi:Arogenate dehydratase prephenate dehydratase [Musa troglodytarum]|uniref:Arogenate dehydratase prephenate dehydratase n=1 Tax=Musa troglodytarum TaxID=320322 RepID=A0A9E7L396_9LILI|nr:Arogenate dehydratase prephenate dehydratase [Musa troglodytarum]
MDLKAPGTCSCGALHLRWRDLGRGTPVALSVPVRAWRRERAQGRRPKRFELSVKLVKDESLLLPRASFSLAPPTPPEEESLIASKGLGDVGAIASAQAAEIYGLHILEDKIQNFESSSRSISSCSEFSLFMIESRPQRKCPLRVDDDTDHGTAKYFDYLFYIDFEASMAEPRAQNALSNLQELVTFLRVLGSFPMDMTL